MFSAKDLFFASQGGYRISNSLRFRASASAYLNRTPGTAGNRKTWTWSGWVKRGTINAGASLNLFSASGTTFNNGIEFTGGGTNDVLRLQLDGNNAGVVPTVAVYRDPSAWYHIIVSVDTTQATAANRVRIYVNGTEVSYGSTTYPTQNYDTMFNSTNSHNIGRSAQGANLYFDGYLAEVNFIDGQALTPSSFGETDAATGVWIPKACTVSDYGKNGFYLPFNDATSATTLCNDKAPIATNHSTANNWTPNNISVTSGVTYDSMVDTPTNFDNGGNGAGNYCVISPIDSFATGGVTLSGANLNVSLDRTTYENWARASFVVPSSGKWYFEWTPTAVNTGTIPYFNAGVIAANTLRSTQWTSATFRGMRVNDGQKQTSSTVSTYGGSTSTIPGTDYFMCAIDMDAGSIYFGKNGNWANGTGSFNQTFSTAAAAFTDLISAGVTWMPFVYHVGQTTNTGSINFGQRPFGATPPSGYLALNTQNLTTPTIINGAQYMDAVLYSGNAPSSRTITGELFSPDFVWIKSRSAATDHALYDTVRGVQLQLESNTTTAETTESTGLTAFTADGFTVGSLAQVNTNTATYVAWLWDAASSNTTIPVNAYGSTPSIASTVRANVTAGFSIVTFTCPASGNFTVGHGLGVIPAMIIVKSRSTAGNNWCVVHKGMTNMAAYFQQLNTTIAQTNNTSIWANTAPTSTVFSMGTNSACSPSDTAVAYCFAEVAGYSAFGSYVGNNSADGPFVYCGFRPKFVLFKDATTAGAWIILDSSRDPYNVDQNGLAPNNSNAETSYTGLAQADFLSNGFKIRATNANSYWNNVSGNTYIFAAFAENPFKISRAR